MIASLFRIKAGVLPYLISYMLLELATRSSLATMQPSTELTTSNSAPFYSIRHQRSNHNDSVQRLSRYEQAMGAVHADDIDQKVHAMLAATEALKPPPPAPTDGAFGAKKPRFLSKMSGAWDRLHSKGASFDRRNQGKQCPNFRDEGCI